METERTNGGAGGSKEEGAAGLQALGELPFSPCPPPWSRCRTDFPRPLVPGPQGGLGQTSVHLGIQWGPLPSRVEAVRRQGSPWGQWGGTLEVSLLPAIRPMDTNSQDCAERGDVLSV